MVDHAMHAWFYGGKPKPGRARPAGRQRGDEPPECAARSVLPAIQLFRGTRVLTDESVRVEGPFWHGSREFRDIKSGLLNSDGNITSLCQGKMAPEYVKRTIRNAGNTVGFLVASTVYTEMTRKSGARTCRVPVGYAIITKETFAGTTTLQIDILCGGVPGAGIGIKIIDFCKAAKRQGVQRLQLFSVEDRIGYYEKLGFISTAHKIQNGNLPELTEMIMKL